MSAARVLLDTHILIRWLFDQKQLTREQRRALDRATERREPVGISAITLLEISVLVSDRRLDISSGLDELLFSIEDSPAFLILPLTANVASDIGSLSSLRDPADRAIVATARTNGLKLLTSDARIIDSKLVPTIM